MTVSSVWYDYMSHVTREFEMHFKVSRSGEIDEIRRYLYQRGENYFQNRIYYLYGQWVPLSRMRLAFEREEIAIQEDEWIRIEIRSMEGIGKRQRWKAFGELPRKIRFRKPKPK